LAGAPQSGEEKGQGGGGRCNPARHVLEEEPEVLRVEYLKEAGHSGNGNTHGENGRGWIGQECPQRLSYPFTEVQPKVGAR
jgi:hypothetical protein